jgi:hypothetical protein
MLAGVHRPGPLHLWTSFLLHVPSMLSYLSPLTNVTVALDGFYIYIKYILIYYEMLVSVSMALDWVIYIYIYI